MYKAQVIVRAAVRIAVALPSIFCQSAVLAEAPVRILAHATHQDGRLVYHYELVNRANSGIDVSLIHIGERSITTDDPVTYFYSPAPATPEEIGGYLLDIKMPTVLDQLTAPPGWSIDTRGDDSSDYPSDGPLAISVVPITIFAPGQTASVSVRLSERNDSLLDTYFAFGGGSVGYYGGRVERRDVTTPNIAVKLSPSSVTKVSGASLKVQASLTVTDDYDPKPEIKLESITASVPLNPSEIKGAAFGTDDRLFLLPVKKDPTGKPVVYTITYSAMDGTGNKATQSATVTLNP
jgi:hypothetical protein